MKMKMKIGLVPYFSLGVHIFSSFFSFIFFFFGVVLHEVPDSIWLFGVGSKLVSTRIPVNKPVKKKEKPLIVYACHGK